MTDAEPAAITWHHGLMARWWAEFVEPEADELAYYRAAIERFGQPALDLGCGAGRLLVPLLREGLDVDGADVSADMLAQAARLAGKAGSTPRLYAQAVHQLRTDRRYRTIFACGVIGIGVSRAQDLEGFRRVYEALEPGAAFVIGHTLPTAGMSPEGWARWLPHKVGELPRPWRDEWEEKTTADGDQLRLLTRLADLRPVEQRLAYEMRAQLVRDGVVLAEESNRLTENLYFPPELLLMLEVAGFRDLEMAAAYGGEPVFDQPAVVITGRRPA
jgi:SAM-dependent methyltransferase